MCFTFTDLLILLCIACSLAALGGKILGYRQGSNDLKRIIDKLNREDKDERK